MKTEALWCHALPKRDSAHDLSHLKRVLNNARVLWKREGGEWDCIEAAVILHDCVNDKSPGKRHLSSRLAASQASSVLTELGWKDRQISVIKHAIEAHSFSANIEPRTVEARVVQDADRLDALGMIGVARCFAFCGMMGQSLYNFDDPEGITRELDDKSFALDHFKVKLFGLAQGFQTKTGQDMATLRLEKMKDFYKNFLEEIEGR